nr:inverse autotransporter beta domain-containing protein [Serratia microhaemolytica]
MKQRFFTESLNMITVIQQRYAPVAYWSQCAKFITAVLILLQLFFSASGLAQQQSNPVVSQQVNSPTDQWLHQFGSARIGLGIDEDWKLDGSEIDLLFALYDSSTNLLFTQLGARRHDSRTTLNAGIGWRYFQQHWMYGTNLFFDNDLTGHNRRFGIGAEISADYLKFAANSYFALSDWHQAHQMADYDERPANGYDLRLDAYLPHYPQLGGKLVYEQYRGEQVALFGQHNRRKNPHAFTAGLNYTPFPLVTLGAEHRRGKGGEDTRLSLQFNYRFGASWMTHIDPTAVVVRRTLAGGRYDLVERNNNLVLDYKKQSVIRLQLPAQLSAYSQEMVMVDAKVESKYPLDRIEWDGGAIIAAGGAVTTSSIQSALIRLPQYKAIQPGTPDNQNSYIISAVAYDQRGNVSPTAKLRVTVQPDGDNTLPDFAGWDANNNTPDSMPPKQDEQKLLPDPAAPRIINPADSASSPHAKLPTDAVMVSQYQLESKPSASSAKTRLMLTVNNLTQNVQSMLVAATPVAVNSTISTNTSSYLSGSTLTVTVVLKDAYNIAVTGQAAVLASAVVVPNTRLESSAWLDRQDGSYSAIYRTDQPATGLKAQLSLSHWNGDKVESLDYSIGNGHVSLANSSITLDNSNYTAGDEMRLRVVLRDAQNNVLDNLAEQLPSIIQVPGAALKSERWQYDQRKKSYHAVYRAQLIVKKAMATLNLAEGSREQSSPRYTIHAGSAMPSYSSIRLDRQSYPRYHNMRVEVRLRDTYGNPVIGQADQLDDWVSVPGASLKENWVDNGDGSYLAIMSAVLGNGIERHATLRATHWKRNQSLKSAQYDFTPAAVLKDIFANGYSFAANAGFPRTAFSGAKFAIRLSHESATDYTWRIIGDQGRNAVTVSDEGVVSFSAHQPANKHVQVVALQKNGSHQLSYTFTLTDWFIYRREGRLPAEKARFYCASLADGATLPEQHQLINQPKVRGSLGQLWSEWGALTHYPAAKFAAGKYWTSSRTDEQHFNTLNLSNGVIREQHEASQAYVVCRLPF